MIHSDPNIWTVSTCLRWSETSLGHWKQKLSAHTSGTKTKNRWRRSRRETLLGTKVQQPADNSGPAVLMSTCTRQGWERGELDGTRGVTPLISDPHSHQHNTGQSSVNRDTHTHLVTRSNVHKTLRGSYIHHCNRHRGDPMSLILSKIGSPKTFPSLGNPVTR